MQEPLDIIKSIVPEISNEVIDLSFTEAGIDSIDLVAIRVNLEKSQSILISDNDWLSFDSIKDILNFLNTRNESSEKSVTPKSEKYNLKKKYLINMPQMALEALSENWLFKELGDTHWEMLCSGLHRKSFELDDALGNRLYATFVRIRISLNNSLKQFKENEAAHLFGNIDRFGESMYFSNIDFQSGAQKLSANLMTTFSIRNAVDNTKLVKSRPSPGPNEINQLSDFPSFIEDYRQVKKGNLHKIRFEDLEFDVSENSLFEFEYDLNPYYDLNGVNLLYFAAYPIINDYCEAKYFNSKNYAEGRWEQEFYTSFKDIFYYANSNIDDKIIYKLASYEFINPDEVKISSLLIRKSDQQIMARIFTVKTRNSK